VIHCVLTVRDIEASNLRLHACNMNEFTNVSDWGRYVLDTFPDAVIEQDTHSYKAVRVSIKGKHVNSVDTYEILGQFSNGKGWVISRQREEEE